MAPSATATDGLVVSSPWRQGAGRVHDPGPANLRTARQEHQVAARIRLAGDRNEKFEKYHPSFPGRFGDQGQAKTFCRSFFRWYNAEHRHGGISMLTPEQVHFGHAEQVIARRKAVLREAWAAHPERFVSGEPKPKSLPEAVWINPPSPSLTTQEIAL